MNKVYKMTVGKHSLKVIYIIYHYVHQHIKINVILPRCFVISYHFH